MKTSEGAKRRTLRPGGLALTRQALASCAFGPGDLILDAGCGFGATVGFLGEKAGLGRVGLDMDPDRLALARDAACAGQKGCGPLPFVGARLPWLPFRPGVFQGIFCECVLSLVPEKGACLQGFYRILAPGGRLVVADLTLGDTRFPAGGRQETGCTGPPATCLDGALTRADLKAKIEQAGFHILEIRDHTRLLKEMACEMVFEHGSLDRFWQTLTGKDMTMGMAGPCRAGSLNPGYSLKAGDSLKPEYPLKFGYTMVVAVKNGSS